MATPPLKVNGVQCVAGGAGVDADAAGSLSLGATNATTVIVGRSGSTTAIPSKVAITGPTSGNAVTVTGGLGNVSAEAVFRDSNGNARFGIDAMGMPSIGSNHFETEGFGNISASYQTTGFVPTAPKFAVTITGSALGIKARPAIVDTTSVIGTAVNLDAGLAANNTVCLFNNNIALLSSNTSTVGVWEWSAMMPNDFQNVYAQMGLHAALQIAHPQGFGILRRTGTDTNWQLWYDDGVTKTIVAPTTPVAPTASVWQRFRIEYFGSTSPVGTKTARFFVDNTLIGTLTGTQVYTSTSGSDWVASAMAIASIGTQYLSIAEYLAWWSVRTAPLVP